MRVEIQRRAALREGVALELVTLAWMALEAAIAIGAGVVGRSVLLTAFGLDSAIELISGATLLWRLAVEAGGRDVEHVERVERRATWVSAALLVALGLSLLLGSVAGLVTRLEPAGSWAGVAISAAAVAVMPLLAWRKQTVNRVIGSPALRADTAESVACAWMAGATLLGVAASTVLGWWWAEYVAALALLAFVGREAWEALEAAREGRGERLPDQG